MTSPIAKLEEILCPPSHRHRAILIMRKLIEAKESSENCLSGTEIGLVTDSDHYIASRLEAGNLINISQKLNSTTYSISSKGEYLYSQIIKSH